MGCYDAGFGSALTDLIGETDFAAGLVGATDAVLGRAERVYDLKLVFKAAGYLVLFSTFVGLLEADAGGAFTV